MIVTPVNFKGIINIIGKDSIILVNHDAVESISHEKYIDTKRDDDDESLLGIRVKQGTYLNLTSGNKIKIFAPMEEVVDAYKNSEKTDVELKTKHNPLQLDKLL